MKELLGAEEYAKYQMMKKNHMLIKSASNDLKEAKLTEALKNASMEDAIHQENQAEDDEVENFEHLSQREEVVRRQRNEAQNLHQHALNDSQVFGEPADQRTLDRPAKDLANQKPAEEPIQCKGFTISDSRPPSDCGSEGPEKVDMGNSKNSSGSQRDNDPGSKSLAKGQALSLGAGNEEERKSDEEVYEIRRKDEEKDHIMNSSAASAWESNVGSGISIDSEELRPPQRKNKQGTTVIDRRKMDHLLQMEGIYNDYTAQPKQRSSDNHARLAPASSQTLSKNNVENME